MMLDPSQAVSRLFEVLFAIVLTTNLLGARNFEWDIDHDVPVRELEQKLSANPDTKAVFIIGPTYSASRLTSRRLQSSATTTEFH